MGILRLSTCTFTLSPPIALQNIRVDLFMGLEKGILEKRAAKMDENLKLKTSNRKINYFRIRTAKSSTVRFRPYGRYPAPVLMHVLGPLPVLEKKGSQNGREVKNRKPQKNKLL